MSFNWSCPYCGRAQTVTDERNSLDTNYCGVGDVAEGRIVIRRHAIGCANPECKRLTLHVSVGQWADNWGSPYLKAGTEIFVARLLPRGSGKPQPSYIPAPLVEDYMEACLIKDLSPKASATLTRRCLQGMIRDFAGITKRRLFDEIEAR